MTLLVRAAKVRVLLSVFLATLETNLPDCHTLVHVFAQQVLIQTLVWIIAQIVPVHVFIVLVLRQMIAYRVVIILMWMLTIIAFVTLDIT